MGQNVRFDCEADNNENVRIAWRKDQRDILPTDRISFNHQTLVINNVTESDEGFYTCVLQNVAGEITSKASLTVHSTYIISYSLISIIQLQLKFHTFS